MIEEILPKINQFYNKCSLSFTEFHKEIESAEYDACNFKLNGNSVISRTAKITPTKIGQFVTVWKRNENGVTAPFNINDNFDFFISSVKIQMVKF